MDPLAAYAAIVSTIALAWQVLVELRRRKAHIRVSCETEYRDLVITIVNNGDVPENVRYVGFERRLSFIEGAFASGSRLNMGLAGATRDRDRATAQRRFGESTKIDEGEVRHFDPPLVIAPRSDWSWRIPLEALRDRDWSRGFVTKARLATGQEFVHPGNWLTRKLYSYLFRNVLAALPTEPTDDGAPPRL